MYFCIVARTLRWRPRCGDRINAYIILVEHLVGGFKFEKETSEVPYLEHSCLWSWNLATSANRSFIPEKFLKCGAGKGWRRSVGLIV